MQEPRHIAIIMDGNRRYAKSKFLAPWKGHEAGAQKILDVMKWCREAGARILTLYAFSIENFERPAEEKGRLMALFLKGMADKRILKSCTTHRIRVEFIGRMRLFPEEIKEGMRRLMEATKEYAEHTLRFCVGYSGRAEIVDAVQRIIQEGITEVTEEAIAAHLYAADEPDLIIRTGGEQRISNFLLWQGAYSELCFVDSLWPEFSREDFFRCIEQFRQRERRFGK
ncbi:TPA: di-trans,poly-cis-decaprenylcistransferase [Candidatus Woesearchaeota archaeon]|nr:di-trans,poly-cis-decaprenylcistransferase [Candidatus Woesearchaeota archaeon]